MNSTVETRNIVWVERLTSLHIVLFLFKILYCRFEVRYDEHNVSLPAIKILSWITRSNNLKIFIPAALLLNLKDEDGYALDYRRAEDLSAVVELFCREIIPHEPQWFINMTKSYLSSYLDGRITFITMVMKRLKHMENCRHEIYLASHFANYLLIKYYESADTKLKQFVPAISNVKMIAQPFFLIARIVMAQMISGNITGNVKGSPLRPAAWIELEPKHGIWEDFRYSASLFFRNKPYDLVYFLDRSDTPVNGETTECLQKMGFQWIDLHGMKHSFLTWKDVVEMVKYAAANKPYNPLWMIFFRLKFMLYTLLYTNLFTRFNVKLLIQHQETSWLQEPQAQAIKNAGGIMAGFHWSNYLNYQYPSHITPQHVFFVWGFAHHELLRKKGNTCNYILPCGLWVNTAEQTDSIPLSFSPEVKFVISIFDDNFGYNVYQSPETMSLFYMSAMEILEENPTFGAMIKSKTYDMDDILSLPGGGQIAGKIESLISQKRLVVLDFRMISPLSAAKKSDLAICCGINSAGVIAGLHGCTVVYWDCTGWLDFPIYRDDKQKIIFQTPGELKQSVKAFFEGDKSIGDFSRWRKIINYFDDFSGKERIFEFVDSYMGEIANDFDREYSLKYAVDKYLSDNHLSKDMFQFNEWWN